MIETDEGESSQWTRLQQISIIRRTRPMVLKCQQDGVSSEDRSLVIQVTSEEVPREDIEESPRRQRPDDEERCANPEECSQWVKLQLRLRGAATRGTSE